MKGVLDQIQKWEDAYGVFPFWMTVIGIVVGLLLIDLYINCRLLKRMGYPPFWALILWIPTAAEIVWIGLAFWRWPKQKG